jgi:hypothetical protein
MVDQDMHTVRQNAAAALVGVTDRDRIRWAVTAADVVTRGMSWCAMMFS